jgi:hypothetical protein
MSEKRSRGVQLFRSSKRTVAGIGAASIAVGIILVGVPVGARSAPKLTVALPHTASYQLAATVTGLPGQSSAVQVEGSLVADLAHGAFDAHLRLPSAVGPIGPGSIELIASGSTLYAQFPGMGSFLGGRSWVAVDGGAAQAAALAKAGGGMAKVVGDVPGTIARLSSTPKGHPIATVTSTSSTAGSTTTSLLLQLPQLHRARPAPAGTSWLPRSLPLTLTADSQGRLASATSSLTLGSATISISISSTGYDQPVSITVPDASQTFSIPSSTFAGILGLRQHLALPSGSHEAERGAFSSALAKVISLLRH